MLAYHQTVPGKNVHGIPVAEDIQVVLTSDAAINIQRHVNSLKILSAALHKIKTPKVAVTDEALLEEFKKTHLAFEIQAIRM
jgi:hypothetical protein